MKNLKSIRALFAFPGFNASSKLVGKFGDRYARVIQLKRRKKQPSVVTVVSAAAGRYDKKVLRVRDLSVAGWRIYLEFERWRVRCPRCCGVHVEHL